MPYILRHNSYSDLYLSLHLSINPPFQALIQDLLDMRLNRVTVELPEKGEKAAGKGGVKKTYDLNTAADSFLRAYAGSPFPEAVDANEKELAEVRYIICRV
jgi:hypothetical protein